MRLVKRVRPLMALMKTMCGAGGAGGGGGLLPGRRRHQAAPPPREIEVVALAPREVRDTGEYLGSLLSRQSVTVLPQVAGYVRSIHVKPGQQVEAGAPLVEVDAREETAALDSAQAQRSSAKVEPGAGPPHPGPHRGALQGGPRERARSWSARRAQVDGRRGRDARRRGAGDPARRCSCSSTWCARPSPARWATCWCGVGDFVSATTPLTSVAQADVLEVSVSVPVVARPLAAGRTRRWRCWTRRARCCSTSTVFFVAPQADPRTQLVEVKAAFQNTGGPAPERAGARAARLLRPATPCRSRRSRWCARAASPSPWWCRRRKARRWWSARPITLGRAGRAGLRGGEAA